MTNGVQDVCYLLDKASPHLKPYKSFLMVASRLENSAFERPDGWEKLHRKDELLAVTANFLFGKEKKMQWKWQYISEGGELKTVAATGGDVYVRSKDFNALLPLLPTHRITSIMCSGWLFRNLPKPKDKADLVLINYSQA